MKECACGCKGLILDRYPSGRIIPKETQYLKGHYKSHFFKIYNKPGNNVGNKNGRWKGGRFVNRWNYVMVKSHNHPYRNSHNYVPEHRLVMENHLRRYLEPNEVVHHINENRQDNRLMNLQLMTDRQHKTYHAIKGNYIPPIRTKN